jgi:hypothetical protein
MTSFVLLFPMGMSTLWFPVVSQIYLLNKSLQNDDQLAFHRLVKELLHSGLKHSSALLVIEEEILFDAEMPPYSLLSSNLCL